MEKQVRLTQLSHTSGCAAKLGPKTLAEVLGKLPKFWDPMLLVGTETSDDGAVYKITDELALIQTLDFFTPVADDPYTYGQIAAANALSDIYAMGGEPKVALNIVAYPPCLGTEILEQILRGGADKVQEAGAVLAGGHSIQDDEPKYGLSVTGFVHPGRMWKNCGACTGDLLVLTKPLGCGVINTAVKAQLAQEEEMRSAVKSMTTLNKYAKEVLESCRIHACTDVTGFSLAGHGLEMADGSGKTLEIFTECLPILPGAEEYASMGLVPAGTYRNREYMQGRVDEGRIRSSLLDIIYDPQTSGGLLLAIDPQDRDRVCAALEKLSVKGAIIGKVTDRQKAGVILK